MKLVLLRHGQSTWNLENRFTGWTDVDLAEKGVEEARMAAVLLKAEGLSFDIAFTSVLKRAIRTLHIVLEDLDLLWIPEEKSWVLNERHYGALQGLNKAESVREHGEAQVARWRRSYTTRPPALLPDDPRHPKFDPRYRGIDPSTLPGTESLADTCARVIPYWNARLLPLLGEGKRLIISAHGNSLRALVKHLDGLSDEAIAALNIPTGFPLVYTFDAGLRPADRRYLGDPRAVEAAIAGVIAQTGGRAKPAR
jgi:2,3-bisphosphoglycerate-dependent phosphoglycerate mutase